MRTLLFIPIILFASCKKQNNQNPDSNNNSLQSADWGVFVSTYNTVNYISAILYDSIVQASFYAAEGQSENRVSAGNVNVNGVPMVFWPGNVSIYNTSNNCPMQSFSWSVSGSASVSPMSFSYTASYPQYQSNISQLDTISKSEGFPLMVSNVANNSHPINISVTQGTVKLTKNLSNTGGTLTITTADIQNFNVNSEFKIAMTFVNHSRVFINGKYYSVNCNKFYNKSCYLKN